MKGFYLNIYFLFFLLFTNSTIASVTIFTDRNLWEQAAATKGSIQIDDFESYPISPVRFTPGPGHLNIGETEFNDFSIFSSAYDGCDFDGFFDCQPVEPTNYNTIVSESAYSSRNLTGNYLLLNHTSNNFDTVTTDKILFNDDIYALGFDLDGAASNGGMIFSIPIDVSLENLIVNSILGTPPTGYSRGTGFIGIVADHSFTEVIFDIEGIPHDNEYFGLDNISYVSSVPVPATIWLFSSALVWLVAFKRKL